MAQTSGTETGETTHFGERTVPLAEKQGLVNEVFHDVADRYDLMNDLMSGGVHRLWKDAMVARLAPPKTGAVPYRVLDMAGGTGDIAERIVNASVGYAEVTVSDINSDMLRVGAERAKTWRFPAQVKFVEANAEELPFADESFDAYTIAFGIRNVPRIDKALAEAYRVLKRGGRFLCLEFSQVDTPVLAEVYTAFSDRVIPPIGKAVTGDAQPYQYLVESIRKFPTPARFSPDDRDGRVQARHAHADDRQYRGAARRLEALTHGAFGAYFRLLRAGFVLAREGALSLVDNPALPPVMRAGVSVGRLFERPEVRSSGRVERLTRALNRLGPTYVKFGQTLATRPDIVGTDVAADLAVLQDKMDPFDPALVPGHAGRGAGRARRATSRRFRRPIAAASIAQVHKAMLDDENGRRAVAVKILRPGDRTSASAPISRASMPARASPSGWCRGSRRLRPIEIVKMLDRSARLELDLRLEAAVDLGVRRQHQGRYGLRHPRGALGPHGRDGADHQLGRRHPDPRHRGARCGRRRPQGAGAEPAAELPPPHHPRRLLPRRPAPGQSVRRSEHRRHRRRRFRHHGPAHASASGASSPTSSTASSPATTG